MIPAPAFVGLDVVKIDVLVRALELLELLANQKLPVVIRHIDMHLLARHDLANDVREILRHGVILPRKRNPLRPRPTEPGRGVGVPLGGEGVTELSGGFVKDFELGHFEFKKAI